MNEIMKNMYVHSMTIKIKEFDKDNTFLNMHCTVYQN